MAMCKPYGPVVPPKTSQVPMNLVETQGLGSVQGGLELEMTGASQAS